MLGESEFDQKSRDVPAFKAAWLEIEGQLQREGASGATVDLAKEAYLSAYKGLGSQAGVTGEQVISAAKEYVLVGKTIAGAVGTVQGLIQAAKSGAPPEELTRAFSGVMIGTLVAAGAVSAGVGAAIVAGISVALSALREIGLFKEPQGVEICPGVRCNPAPSFTVNCICAYGDVIASPGSTNWRHFPEPSTDSAWYRASSPFSFTWTSAGSNSLATWAGPGYPRPIDTAFDDFYHLECESKAYSDDPVGQFRKAFFAAWKVNKAYALNGLRPVEDWKVLVQTVRMWNMAHEPGQPYVVPDRGRQDEIKSYQTCSAQVVPYVEIVAREVANSSPPDFPVRIHTGPLKKTGPMVVLRKNLSSMLNQPSASSSSSLTGTVVKGAAITAAAGAAGIFLYAWYTGQTVRHVVSGLPAVGRFFARENPYNRGRRVAYRVRLDSPIEYVTIGTGGRATIVRHGRQVAQFLPTRAQLAKIRAGVGEILVYTDQI